MLTVGGGIDSVDGAVAAAHWAGASIVPTTSAHEIYLLLHGAMVTEDYEYTNGHTIRELAGLVSPVAVWADPHAHFAQRMVRTTPLIGGVPHPAHVNVMESKQ